MSMAKAMQRGTPTRYSGLRQEYRLWLFAYAISPSSHRAVQNLVRSPESARRRRQQQARAHGGSHQQP
jgi:hypothetical protein